MQDFSDLSPAGQAKMNEHMQEMNMKETRDMFNGLAENCFVKCVNVFRSPKLDSSENECVKACAQKYMMGYQRVGQRFAEQNIAMQQHAMQAQQQQQAAMQGK